MTGYDGQLDVRLDFLWIYHFHLYNLLSIQSEPTDLQGCTKLTDAGVILHLNVTDDECNIINK